MGQHLDVASDHCSVAGSVDVADSHEQRHGGMARSGAHHLVVQQPRERGHLEEVSVLRLHELLNGEAGIVTEHGRNAHLVLSLDNLEAIRRQVGPQVDAIRTSQSDEHTWDRGRELRRAIDVGEHIGVVGGDAAFRDANHVQLWGIRGRQLTRPVGRDRSTGVPGQSDRGDAGNVEVRLSRTHGIERPVSGLVAGHPVEVGALEVRDRHGVPM